MVKVKHLKKNPYLKSHRKGKKLGGGAFGSVHLYTNNKGAIAIKRFEYDEESKQEFDYEVDGYRKIGKNEHLVEFLEAFSVQKDGYYIVMEFFQGGDLSKIYSDMEDYTEDVVRDVLIQVSKGLAFMNKKKFAHRDIKPENIFVRSWEPLSVAVGDLNFAKKADGNRMTVFLSDLGSGQYKAPEVKEAARRRRGHFYNAKCDVWSLGVILYQLLSGRDDPFGLSQIDFESVRSNPSLSEDEKIQELEQRLVELKSQKTVQIPNSPQWAKVSAEGKHIVRRMLTTDYKNRIDFPEIISSDYARLVFDEDEMLELYDEQRYRKDRAAEEKLLEDHLKNAKKH